LKGEAALVKGVGVGIYESPGVAAERVMAGATSAGRAVKEFAINPQGSINNAQASLISTINTAVTISKTDSDLLVMFVADSAAEKWRALSEADRFELGRAIGHEAAIMIMTEAGGEILFAPKALRVADGGWLDELQSFVRKGNRRFEAIELSAKDQAEVWGRHQFDRGVRIESHLAATEYQDWYRVGAERGGFFELLDFQKGNNVVSLKTSNSTSAATFESLEAHIDDLAIRPLVNGVPANAMLDLRVPKGMESQYSRLRTYASGRVRVEIQGF